MKNYLPLIAILAASPCLAATITFQAGVNGYDHLGLDIRQNQGSNNGQEILTGYQSGTNNVHDIRGLLSFSLASIPAGSIIENITLTLVSNGSQSGTATGVGTVNLHEVRPNGLASNNFSEAATNWTNWGNAGVGTAWNSLGGDYVSTALASAALTGVDGADKLVAGGTATFNTSASFVAAAQAAFDAGLPLELITIAPTAEANTTASNFFRFRSEDFTTIGDRPLLTITYTIPEPTSVLLALLAGVPFIARRRRR